MPMRICKGVYEFLIWSLKEIQKNRSEYKGRNNACWGAPTVFLVVIVDSSVIELFIKMIFPLLFALFPGFPFSQDSGCSALSFFSYTPQALFFIAVLVSLIMYR
jgi:hypothetical protein